MFPVVNTGERDSQKRLRPGLWGSLLLYWWKLVPLQVVDSQRVTSSTDTDLLTSSHTHTHTHGTVSTSEGFVTVRGASGEPLGDPSAVAALGQQGGVVTGTGSPGQCLSPPPVQPQWRPSWRGRSHWWGVLPPSSRSCSVGEGQRSEVVSMS